WMLEQLKSFPPDNRCAALFGSAVIGTSSTNEPPMLDARTLGRMVTPGAAPLLGVSRPELGLIAPALTAWALSTPAETAWRPECIGLLAAVPGAAVTTASNAVAESEMAAPAMRRNTTR